MSKQYYYNLLQNENASKIINYKWVGSTTNDLKNAWNRYNRINKLRETRAKNKKLFSNILKTIPKAVKLYNKRKELSRAEKEFNEIFEKEIIPFIPTRFQEELKKVANERNFRIAEQKREQQEQDLILRDLARIQKESKLKSTRVTTSGSKSILDFFNVDDSMYYSPEVRENAELNKLREMWINDNETHKVIISFTDRGKLRTIEILAKTYAEFEASYNAYFEHFEEYAKKRTFTISTVNIGAGMVGNMILNDIKYMKLPGNQRITANNIIYTSNCVIQGIQLKDNNGNYMYPKLQKYLSYHGLFEECTVDKLVSMCDAAKCSYNIMTRDLKTYKSNIVDHKKVFTCIVSNEHLYPVTRQDLKFLRSYKKDSIEINDIKLCTVDFINDMMTKHHVDNFRIKNYIDHSELERVVIDNILYVTNKETMEHYELMKSVFPNFNFTIPINFNSNKFLSAICEKFGLMSYAYEFMDNPSIIRYQCDVNVDVENAITVDKNKAYLSCLINLDYLPKIDCTCEMKIYDGSDINMYNFYYVNVVKDCLGLLCDGWLSGFAIMEFDKELYEISYYIEPILIPNFLKDSLITMANKNMALTRDIVNRFIGSVQCRDKDKTTIRKYTGLYNNIDEIEGKYETINSGKYSYYVSYDDVEIRGKRSSGFLPLSYYVIDRCKMLLFRKMKELKNIKIIKINTDSITYIQTGPINQILDKDDMNGWKLEKTKLGHNHVKRSICKKIDFKENHINYFKFYESGYINCLAGSGKSYHIMNKLIKITHDINEEAKILVLAAQHNVLSDFRNIKQITNTVIQNIIYNKINITNYDYIIVDEAGLLSSSHYNYLFSNISKLAKVFLYGDSHQLPPVNENITPFSNNYIKSQFQNFYYMHTNYRNNFSADYYYKCMENPQMESKLFDYLSDDARLVNVLKSGKIPYIICYLNETCDKINKMLTAKWETIRYHRENYKISKGPMTFIKCINNKMKKMDIYNKCTFNIIDYDTEYVQLQRCKFPDNVYGEPITIKIADYVNNFKPAYANTLYSVQGSSIPFENLVYRDAKLLRKDGKSYYTAISRIYIKK